MEVDVGTCKNTASYQLLLGKWTTRWWNAVLLPAVLNTNANGVSLYEFPKDEALRSQRIKQVQRFRAQWTATSYSELCSKRFNNDCFEPDSKIAATFGMKRAKRLKSSPIPTSDRPSSSEEVRRKLLSLHLWWVARRREVPMKRENYRVRLNKLSTLPYHECICSLYR